MCTAIRREVSEGSAEQLRAELTGLSGLRVGGAISIVEGIEGGRGNDVGASGSGQPLVAEDADSPSGTVSDFDSVRGKASQSVRRAMTSLSLATVVCNESLASSTPR